MKFPCCKMLQSGGRSFSCRSQWTVLFSLSLFLFSPSLFLAFFVFFRFFIFIFICGRARSDFTFCSPNLKYNKHVARAQNVRGIGQFKWNNVLCSMANHGDGDKCFVFTIILKMIQMQWCPHQIASANVWNMNGVEWRTKTRYRHLQQQSFRSGSVCS